MSATQRFGLTWWGQRWIAALEALGALYANRLPRGRTYARRGTVSGLEVAAGRVTARVAGSRAQPYRVRLELPVFDDATWQAAVAALAGQVRHAAALADGRMPDDVDDTLADAGVSLFPGAGELATSCSCPDAANPCKHVAAVHYVLAQAFDADPFLLFRLRGREHTELLAALRAARAGEAVPAAAGDGDDDGTVALSALSAGQLWAARGDLSAVAAAPHEPDDPEATLRALGPMPAPAGAAPADLAPVVADAATVAWRLVAGDPDHADDEEPVLAALRLRGSATSGELAGDLRWRVEQVRARLRPLVTDGVVRRTGHGPGTRYHA